MVVAVERLLGGRNVQTVISKALMKRIGAQPAAHYEAIEGRSSARQNWAGS